MTLNEIYIECDKKNIEVYPFKFDSNIKGVALPDGSIAVDTDKISSNAEELEIIAHEEGHIETGSFYNIYSPLDIRAKHEKRAEKYAIKKLIPKDELDNAFNNGITEYWELAEYFNVTCEFMIKAINFYKESAENVL